MRLARQAASVLSKERSFLARRLELPSVSLSAALQAQGCVRGMTGS